MKTHVGVSPFLPVGLMTPQHCPFCSFLHAFLGLPLHWSPNLSLPKRHRKQCIVCPATKGNAETPKWPPHSQPTPFTQSPQTLGDLESSDCQRSFTIWHPCGPGNIPSLFFEGSMPGGPLALQHQVWRKVRRGQDRAETSDSGNATSPRDLAGWTGALVLYQRCYISVKGWGGEGVTGAMEVETPPPSGQQMFLFVQSLFLFFVFFFLVDGDSCEFSKGAI